MDCEEWRARGLEGWRVRDSLTLGVGCVNIDSDMVGYLDKCVCVFGKIKKKRMLIM